VISFTHEMTVLATQTRWALFRGPIRKQHDLRVL